MHAVNHTASGDPRGSREGGAVMIIFVVCAAVLFGFAAIAVDVAHAFVERRDSQAAVDVATIAGALTLVDSSANDYQKAVTLVDEVYEYTQKNLGPGLDWTNCTDPDRPGQFTVVASNVFVKGLDPQYTECISWSSDWSEVRVQLPSRDVETFFGSVIGFDAVEVAAFAEVNAVVVGAGATLPFGVLESGTNELLCLKTGPKFPDDCDPNATGNFGFIDFQIFGNSAMGTISPGCNANPNDLLKENIAHGVDHDLTMEPLGVLDSKDINDEILIIKEDQQCPDNRVKVMAAPTSTGNRDKVLLHGFVTGFNGFPGRLTVAPGRTIAYEGVNIDDIGLWEWLADGDSTAPGIQNVCAGATDEASIIACVDANKGSGTPLFSRNIATSPRLAVIPVLWQSSFPSGSGYVSFKRFQFVYIQGLYGSCDSKGVCDTEIVPNETFKTKPNVDPVVVTAIPIPHSELDAEIVANFGAPRVVTYALSR